jgi:hypothetical protein
MTIWILDLSRFHLSLILVQNLKGYIVNLTLKMRRYWNRWFQLQANQILDRLQEDLKYQLKSQQMRMVNLLLTMSILRVPQLINPPSIFK